MWTNYRLPEGRDGRKIRKEGMASLSLWPRVWKEEWPACLPGWELGRALDTGRRLVRGSQAGAQACWVGWQLCPALGLGDSGGTCASCGTSAGGQGSRCSGQSWVPHTPKQPTGQRPPHSGCCISGRPDIWGHPVLATQPTWGCNDSSLTLSHQSRGIPTRKPPWSTRQTLRLLFNQFNGTADGRQWRGLGRKGLLSLWASPLPLCPSQGRAQKPRSQSGSGWQQGTERRCGAEGRKGPPSVLAGLSKAPLARAGRSRTTRPSLECRPQGSPRNQRSSPSLEPHV